MALKVVNMLAGAAAWPSVPQTADQLVFSHWHKHLSAIKGSHSAAAPYSSFSFFFFSI